MVRMRDQAWFPRRAQCRLLKTDQTTVYHGADDGDLEFGFSKEYIIWTAGLFSGTVNLDVPHYAANTISFTAPNTVSDSANGLATILTGDVVVIRGSASNDGVYTVTAGGVAGSFTVTAGIVNEVAGAYVSICKRTTHSNNHVLDRRTGLGWSRYTSSGEAVGPTSTGTLVWYDATLVFTLHPGAADLQMIAGTNTLRVVGGAGEVARYHVGDVIDCAGFANAVNNLPGYVILSVTVNGADLDIVLDPFNNTLISEAAGGSRSIGLVCRSIFAYCAAANAASLGGYTDWRVPNIFELQSIRDYGLNHAAPDITAFPGWPTRYIWTSTTDHFGPLNALWIERYGQISTSAKTTAYYCALVRGG